MNLAKSLTILSFGLYALLPGCGNAALAQHRQQEQLARDASAKQLLANGDASASMGDMTRAEQYYVAALKGGGNERDLVQRLLVVCASDQRYPVAVEYAEQYLHRHPLDVDLKFAAGSIHAALGEARRARELFESVVRDRPEWPEPHYALASLLRAESEPLALADQQDLEYLRLSPHGALAETARARLSRRALP